MVRLKDVLSVRDNKELYKLYKKISSYRGDMIEIEYSITQKTHDILILYLCDALTDKAMFEAIVLASFSHEYYNLVSLPDSVVQACELGQSLHHHHTQAGQEALATGTHLLDLGQAQDRQHSTQRQTDQDGVEADLQRHAQALQVLHPTVILDDVEVDFLVDKLPEVERVGLHQRLNGQPPLLKDGNVHGDSSTQF